MLYLPIEIALGTQPLPRILFLYARFGAPYCCCKYGLHAPSCRVSRGEASLHQVRPRKRGSSKCPRVVCTICVYVTRMPLSLNCLLHTCILHRRAAGPCCWIVSKWIDVDRERRSWRFRQLRDISHTSNTKSELFRELRDFTAAQITPNMNVFANYVTFLPRK